MDGVLSLSEALGRFWEVIIVGAGPAGTAAAMELAQHHVSVLLMDRYAFPREKACGDAVMPPALIELQKMGVLEKVQELALPVTQLSSQSGNLSMLRTVGPVTWEGQNHRGLVLPRSEFDTILWKHACSFDVCCWLPATAALAFSFADEEILLEVRTAPGQSGRLRARVVIAADGSQSRLARQLRQWHFRQPELDRAAVMPPYDQAGLGETHFTALRGYCHQGVARDILEFFYPLLDEILHYFWMFPVPGNHYNVGVIAKTRRAQAQRYQFREELLRHVLANAQNMPQEPIQISSMKAAPIDCGLRSTALYGPRMLCIGDAAALADPESAEGISGALWSGRAAAQIVGKWLIGKTVLAEYGNVVAERYAERYQLPH